MAAYNKFYDYSEQKNRAVHNWGSATFKLMLTNVAPVATNSVKADLTEISAGNGYTAGGTALTGVSISETTGVTTVQANQVTFTASGGAIATFRYYVLYNDTAASDNLVAWWDHGVAVNLADGDSFTVKFNNASPGTIFTDS
jgi:hypothetical protein